MSGVGSTEEVAEPFQAPLDGPEGLPGLAVGELEVELLAVHGVLAEPLLRPFEGQALFVEEALDLNDEVHVPPTVNPLPRRVFLRAEELELRLPVSENVRGDPEERGDLADAEEELLGYLGHSGPANPQ